jgi:hypothetical protein
LSRFREKMTKNENERGEKLFWCLIRWWLLAAQIKADANLQLLLCWVFDSEIWSSINNVQLFSCCERMRLSWNKCKLQLFFIDT